VTGGQVTTHSHFTDGIFRAGLNYQSHRSDYGTMSAFGTKRTCQRSGLLPCARLDKAVDKMRGPVNTKIKLTIMRKGFDKPLEVTIGRNIIRVKSVRYPLGMIA